MGCTASKSATDGAVVGNSAGTTAVGTKKDVSVHQKAPVPPVSNGTFVLVLELSASSVLLNSMTSHGHCPTHT